MSRGRAALAAALLWTALAAPPLRAQQNHVVVDRFDWKVRSTAHFDIYYYEGSAPLVHDAARILEESFAEVTRDLDIPLALPPWMPKHMKKAMAKGQMPNMPGMPGMPPGQMPPMPPGFNPFGGGKGGGFPFGKGGKFPK